MPTPEISELRDSRLEAIDPGRTTRRDLEESFVSSDVFVARVSPPYVIYAEYRSSFAFAVLAEVRYSQVYGNVDDHLVVECDEDDTVVGFERRIRCSWRPLDSRTVRVQGLMSAAPIVAAGWMPSRNSGMPGVRQLCPA